MDIEKLKESIDPEIYSEIEAHISDLTGQRDAARNESINGRKSLKEKVSTYESQISQIMEKLGVESVEDIGSQPAEKDSGEKLKQYESRLKRLERELADAQSEKQAVESKYMEARRQSIVSDALSSHDFVANDVVSSYIGQRLVWEDDELLFKQDDGNLISVKDGVAAFAKARPELVRATGAGGAGVRPNNARGGEGHITMTRAEFESLPPQKQMEVSKSGVTLQ